MRKPNIYWRAEREDLWERVKRYARMESAMTDEDVSPSEWLARAAEERMKRQRKTFFPETDR